MKETIPATKGILIYHSVFGHYIEGEDLKISRDVTAVLVTYK